MNMSDHNSDNRARVARSPSEWQSLVAQFEAGGMSKSAFCRQHGVAFSSFAKALVRLGGAQAPTAAPSPFVAVSVPAPEVAPTATWDVELQLSPDTIIRVRMG